MRLHNRMVKVEFWTDTDLICDFSRDQRLFYQGLWQLADDSGCIEDKPKGFKALLFPLDTDLTALTLGQWVEDFVVAGKMIRYAVNGKPYLYLMNFRKHQILKNPSPPDAPLPPWLSWQTYDSNNRTGHYVLDEGMLATLYTPTPCKTDSSYTPLTPALQSSDNLLLKEPKLTESKRSEINMVAPASATQQESSEAETGKLTRVFNPDEAPFYLSRRLQERIVESDPKSKVARFTEKQLQGWALHMDRLIRLDGRDPPEIERVIDWCQQDSFWRSNVLSAQTFREKYEQMFRKMMAGNANSGRQPWRGDHGKHQGSVAAHPDTEPKRIEDICTT